MSNFIDSIRARLSGKEKAIIEPVKTKISIEPQDPTIGLRIKEYHIGIEWKKSGFCSDRELPAMLENVVREIREDIYGDLRRRTIRLECSLYEHDFNTAQMEIRDIVKEIFG